MTAPIATSEASVVMASGRLGSGWWSIVELANASLIESKDVCISSDQFSLITHGSKTKTATPGKVENPQQDLKLLFNTTKYQFDREPSHCHEYGGITERLMLN